MEFGKDLIEASEIDVGSSAVYENTNGMPMSNGKNLHMEVLYLYIFGPFFIISSDFDGISTTIGWTRGVGQSSNNSWFSAESRENCIVSGGM